MIDDFKFDNCTPDIHFVSSQDGNKYEVFGCDKCGFTLAGKSVSPTKEMVVGPGTFDDTTDQVPQAHIWIKEKQNWVEIPDNLPSFEENYVAAQL